MIDIRDLIESIERTVENHNLGRPGSYQRWKWQNHAGTRDLTANAYGCADAANILYTIGSLPSDCAGREGFVTSLQSFQDPATGFFREDSHHPIHTTAHCTAALELFEARPRFKLGSLSECRQRRALESFLDRLDWGPNPWHASHRGAGLYSALVLNGEVSAEWQDWYFDWLWREADPETGFWRKGFVSPQPARQDGHQAPLFHHMAGSFHYLFVHEYAHRPLRYPERVIDSCMALYRERTIPIPVDQSSVQAESLPTTYDLGKEIGFAEIDWIYCMNRSRRQTPYRFEEATEMLLAFSRDYLAYLCAEVDTAGNDRFNDLHWLFGTTCALAEIEQALPGFLKSEKPLKLVLDRRPFI
ncbi:MAG TPA: hypothetical protein VMX75_12990 [Spirochaetia bacterium]|nr:hypothetical protein [Spirochaetia bacterium]